MQQEKTGLRGDGHADLVVELEPGATFEAFLVQEYLDVADELRLVGGGQARKNGHVVGDNFPPLWRERSGPQPLASESFTLGNFHGRKLETIMPDTRAQTRSNRGD